MMIVYVGEAEAVRGSRALHVSAVVGRDRRWTTSWVRVRVMGGGLTTGVRLMSLQEKSHPL